MIMLSQDDSNKIEEILFLFNQYLLKQVNKKQYIITNINKINIPNILLTELEKGSKYINHFKINEEEDKYCIIFEKDKTDN